MIKRQSSFTKARATGQTSASRRSLAARKLESARSALLKRKLKGVSRRNFIETVAVASATLAAASRLDGSAHRSVRTLFFNFSHEDHVGHTYYLVFGKNRYQLESVHPSHPALLKASRSNKLLRSLPTGAVTHVIQNLRTPADQVLLGYTIKDPDISAGTWSMSSIYLQVPTTSIGHAYTQARRGLLEGAALPMSAKRMKYGLPAAASLQDLMDEQELVDATDWAKAMVNVHPELLCADPNNAAHIQNNLIDARTVFALSQKLELASPAAPSSVSSIGTPPSNPPWATLVPYTDDDGVTPLRNTTGNNKGLILYDAQWSSDIKPFVANTFKPTSAAAKSDSTLGGDITGANPTDATDGLNGLIWFRRDGNPSVDQSPGFASARVSAAQAAYTLTNITPDYDGYSVSAKSAVSSDQVNVTLNFTNWYVRWLGIYAQFLDGNKVVPLSSLPAGVGPDNSLNRGSSYVYLGVLTPEFTILGIPVSSSGTSATFPFPTQVATSARILASGVGQGSHTDPDSEPLGVALTSIFNLSIPPLLLVLGVASQIDVLFKAYIFPSATLIIQEISLAVSGGSSGQEITTFIRSLAKYITNPGGPLKTLVTKFGGFLAEAEASDALEDAIPIAGVILQAIGIFGAIAELAESSTEVLLSPWTYTYNLVGTHDLSVTLTPDSTPPQTGLFPASAATYTVKAVFDDGTPHLQTLTMPSNGNTQTLPPVVFTAVPLGGNVTVSVAFYTVDNTLVGRGTSTAVNDVNANPTITVDQVELPITTSTVYQHKQKTTLDSAGNHVWACAPAPAIAPSACEANPGNLCGFRGITANYRGNVGYGWQSFNNTGCASAGAGQLDQMANIFSSNDSSGNAQATYAFTPCALEPGTKLIYDPLGRADLNYYLDATNSLNLVRQIQLNPPAFSDPRSNNAWGKFNLNSDDLFLHPAGALVSINSNSSRLESLRLPSAAVSDADAAVNLLATIHGGNGTRPGLLKTPTVTTVTSEGVILVLESGNNRIHALDLHGNPVQLFKNQPTRYFLNFSETGGANTQYLDMAVEFSGFIYVLSLSNSVYRLDVYNSDQTGTAPICSTMGFNAAKVAVDYWRNVYSLNYEVLKRPDGTLPANGVTEPSISQWLPTTPPPCQTQQTLNMRPASVRQQVAIVPSARRPLRRRELWSILAT